MQGRTPIILLSTTAEAPEMQTLLPHGNMMNLVVPLKLYWFEWEWTGSFTREVLRVAPKETKGGEF